MLSYAFCFLNSSPMFTKAAGSYARADVATFWNWLETSAASWIVLLSFCRSLVLEFTLEPFFICWMEPSSWSSYPSFISSSVLQMLALIFSPLAIPDVGAGDLLSSIFLWVSSPCSVAIPSALLDPYPPLLVSLLSFTVPSSSFTVFIAEFEFDS